jgi:hypothetical protein
MRKGVLQNAFCNTPQKTLTGFVRMLRLSSRKSAPFGARARFFRQWAVSAFSRRFFSD